MFEFHIQARRITRDIFELVVDPLCSILEVSALIAWHWGLSAHCQKLRVHTHTHTLTEDGALDRICQAVAHKIYKQVNGARSPKTFRCCSHGASAEK